MWVLLMANGSAKPRRPEEENVELLRRRIEEGESFWKAVGGRIQLIRTLRKSAPRDACFWRSSGMTAGITSQGFGLPG